MKKYISIVILIMCVSLLIGCDKKSQNANNLENDNKQSVTTNTSVDSTADEDTEVNEDATTSIPNQSVYNIVLNQEYVNEDATGGSDYLFKENNKLVAHAWAKNAGGTEYHGIYKIVGNTLTATITEYQDVTGEWKKLPDSEVKAETYTLTSASSFVNNKGEIWNLK